jgi:hypothetical protein
VSINPRPVSGDGRIAIRPYIVCFKGIILYQARRLLFDFLLYSGAV